MVRERQITAMGCRTRVREAGPEDASEAVVFIHGGPGSANDWDWFLPRVGERARAVAFDVLGFGRAEKPARFGYGGPAWGTFVQHVLGELGVRRVHLVANDLGGEAATHWAAAHPDAFASAAFVNTGALIRYRWHPIAQASRLPALGALSVLLGGVLMRPALRALEPPLPSAVLDRWREDYDWASRRAIRRFYSSAPATTTSFVVDALRRLDRPALVVWGAKNHFIPVKHAEDQRESFPHARVVVLEGEGHYAHVRSPEAVGRHVLPFLEEQLGHTDRA